MRCLAIPKLFEFGLAVEFTFVNANVCTADVVVAGLMVSAVCVMVKWKFNVDCRCLLRARESVGFWCDVMLLKELLPLLMALRGVGEVKDAGEVKKAMGEDKVVFVNGWMVVYEVFQESGCGVNVSVKLLLLRCCKLCGVELVG